MNSRTTELRRNRLRSNALARPCSSAEPIVSPTLRREHKGRMSPVSMPTSERLAVTIPEAVRLLGVGRSTLYALMGRGDLAARKVGRRTLITTASIHRFLEALPAAQIAAPKQAA
jgi:excisionase family DNA binding protein